MWKIDVKSVFVDEDGEASAASKSGLATMLIVVAVCGILGAVAGCIRGWATEATFLGSAFGWCGLGLLFGVLVGFLGGVIMTLVVHMDM